MVSWHLAGLPYILGPFLLGPFLGGNNNLGTSTFSRLKQQQDLAARITDLEQVPTCAHYVRGSTSLDHDMLSWGDETGRLNFFKMSEGWGSHEKKPGAAEIHPKRISGLTPVRRR